MKKTIVILGAGESGTGAALLAQKKGFQVFLSDQGKIKDKYKTVLLHHNIRFEEQKHSTNLILAADEIIKSPGIPGHAPIICKARKKNIPVISEIEFAARYSRAKKICITGSNGKTTTTLLIWNIMKNAGLDAGLCGNIGNSMAALLCERDYDFLVIELSSFQLDEMYHFKAEIAILLNITPDHLDRYDNSFEKYAQSKFRIFQNQSAADAMIYCDDDPTIKKHLIKNDFDAIKYAFSIKKPIKAEGAYLIPDKKNYLNSKINININSEKMVMTLQELALGGKHNVYNSMAAAITAQILDIRKDSIKQSLLDFQGVEHRLEFVASIRGVDFINDSKATNINSTWYALENATRPVIWIAGGQDKGNDYASLIPLVEQKVKAIICLGVENNKIIETFENATDHIYESLSADDAVNIAYKMAQKGDMVLLSPACASFDLFENYEDRGNQFKKSVMNL